MGQAGILFSCTVLECEFAEVGAWVCSYGAVDSNPSEQRCRELYTALKRVLVRLATIWAESHSLHRANRVSCREH